MWIFTLRTGIFLISALVVEAGEYCTSNYNSHEVEYCSGYCCSSEDDSCCSDWGWIAGVVVGCIVFIAIVGTILFLVCQKMNAKKSQTVHVQMSNNRHNSYQNNHRNSRRQPQPPNYNNPNTMYTTNMSGNAYLPPPPPYSQTYDGHPGNPAYPPPPPYPGSPLPGSNLYSGGNNSLQPPQTHMTSHAPGGNIAYPPPPVS